MPTYSMVVASWGNMAPIIIDTLNAEPRLGDLFLRADAKSFHSIACFLRLSPERIQGRQLADALLTRTPTSLLHEVLPDVGPKFPGVFNQVEPSVLTARAYRRLATAFMGQAGHLMLEPMDLTTERLSYIEALNTLDPMVMEGWPLLQGNADRAGALHCVLSMLRATGCADDKEALREEVRTLTDFTLRPFLVARLKNAKVPEPPLTGDSVLSPIRTVPDLLEVAERYRVPDLTEITHVRAFVLGQIAVVEWLEHPRALVVLRSDRVRFFTLGDLHAESGPLIGPTTRQKIIAALQQRGVRLLPMSLAGAFDVLLPEGRYDISD